MGVWNRSDQVCAVQGPTPLGSLCCDWGMWPFLNIEMLLEHQAESPFSHLSDGDRTEEQWDVWPWKTSQQQSRLCPQRSESPPSQFRSTYCQLRQTWCHSWERSHLSTLCPSQSSPHFTLTSKSSLSLSSPESHPGHSTVHHLVSFGS